MKAASSSLSTYERRRKLRAAFDSLNLCPA